jgi:hypothetical protein
MEVFAMWKSISAVLSAVLGVLAACDAALAVDYGDHALFSTVAPDAMIVLDLSGGISLRPKDENDSSEEPLRRIDTDSGNPFQDALTPGFTTDSTRYLITKRAICKILDDNRCKLNDQKGGFLSISQGNVLRGVIHRG